MFVFCIFLLSTWTILPGNQILDDASMLMIPRCINLCGTYNTSRTYAHIACFAVLHDNVIKWKHFPRYWPFVRGIHLSPVNSPHKGQWRRVLMFSLICTRINSWVNNREAGDLRRHFRYVIYHGDHVVISITLCFRRNYYDLGSSKSNIHIKPNIWIIVKHI